MLRICPEKHYFNLVPHSLELFQWVQLLAQKPILWLYLVLLEVEGKMTKCDSFNSNSNIYSTHFKIPTM